MDDKKLVDRELAETYAGWFRALADATRVQVLNLLAEHGEPMTVGQIVERMPVGQSTVSAHLKILAQTGFVLVEQRGTARWYRVNQQCVSCFPTAADVVMGRGGLVPIGDPVAEPDIGTRASSTSRVVPMTAEHADQVLAIYQSGLDTGNASFETTAPDWAHWDAGHRAGQRFVALDESGDVLGWVAATPVSSRCVYAGVLEHSIYIRPDQQGRGIGRLLLDTYIAASEAAGVWTLQSGIFPENTGSLALHERAGFRIVGRRERLGEHHGTWRDVILIERRSALAG